MTQDTNDMNSQAITEFRANSGKVGGYFAHLNLVLLHHKGAKSGVERINPLAYLNENDHIYIFASLGGAPKHPDWYFNVLANSDVTVELGTETYEAQTVEIKGKERDRIYNIMGKLAPQFADYEVTAKPRVIPVVELVRKN